MWVDPDSGQTWEQIAATVWRTLSPKVRERCDVVLAATGQTREAFCQDAHRQFQARLADAERNPDSAFAKELEAMEFPCGRDPLLRPEP